jgi:hypothetical protein
VCVFEGVQDFVAPVHARPDFMLAHKGGRILEIAEDAAVDETKFWSKIEFDVRIHDRLDGARVDWRDRVG